MRFDPVEGRVLSQNVERMGIRMRSVVMYSPARLRTVPQFSDRIVVDAPCSGKACSSKDPEAREEVSSENVETRAARQLDIFRGWPASRR